MNDDWIETALRAGPPDEPPYPGASRVRPRARSSATLGSVLAPILGLAVVVVVASTLLRPAPSDDVATALPSDILTAGVLRIGVSDAAPQLVAGGGIQGFDIDVAREVGRRLGITAQVSAGSSPELFEAPGRWDLILATGPAAPNATDIVSGEPYLWRSGAVVDRAEIPIRSLDDVAGQTVCLVDGGMAAAWLEGGLPLDAVSEQPPAITVVGEPSLSACLERLRRGAVAAVIADWDYEVASVPPGLSVSDVRPFSVPASARVAGTDADAMLIIRATDAALAAMRSDGTLRELSRHRFGGADYTNFP